MPTVIPARAGGENPEPLTDDMGFRVAADLAASRLPTAIWRDWKIRLIKEMNPDRSDLHPMLDLQPSPPPSWPLTSFLPLVEGVDTRHKARA
jgi:hypothetical protein